MSALGSSSNRKLPSFDLTLINCAGLGYDGLRRKGRYHACDGKDGRVLARQD